MCEWHICMTYTHKLVTCVKCQDSSAHTFERFHVTRTRRPKTVHCVHRSIRNTSRRKRLRPKLLGPKHGIASSHTDTQLSLSLSLSLREYLCIRYDDAAVSLSLAPSTSPASTLYYPLHSTPRRQLIVSVSTLHRPPCHTAPSRLPQA